MLWLFKINFRGFCRFLIHGTCNSSYVVLYTQCLRHNICSAWFLDIRISTCFTNRIVNQWNSLPQHVITSDSLNKFKNNLDQYWYEIRYGQTKKPLAY